jgi:hypothetical protein
MNVCMYLCKLIRTYVCMHIYIFIYVCGLCMYEYICVYVCAYVCIYMYVYLCMYVCVCVCIYVRAYVYVCVCVHICVCVCVCLCTHYNISVTHCKAGTVQQFLDSAGPRFESETSHIGRMSPNYSISLLDEIWYKIKNDINETACEYKLQWKQPRTRSVVGSGKRSVKA